MSSDSPKVLYLLFERSGNPGVLKKVRQQLQEVNKRLEVQGVFLLPEQDRGTEVENSLREYVPSAFIRFHPEKKPPRIFHRRGLKKWRWHIKRFIQGRAFSRAIQEVLEEFNPDQLYIRYPLDPIGLLSALEKKKLPYILEFNGNPFKILENRYRERGGRLDLLRWKRIEKEGRKILQSASGMVCVGHGLLNDLRQRGAANIPAKVIPNGIDLDLLPVRTPPSYEKPPLRLLYLTGFLREVDGMDLIFEGLSKWKEEGRDFELNLTLEPDQEVQELIEQHGLEEHVHFLGWQDKEGLDRLFDEHHLALGAMAFFRVDNHWNSALKALEYLGRGIPFIVGYKEEHLQPPPASIRDLYWELDLRKEAFPDWERVRSFAEKVCSDKGHPQRMRELAEQRVRMDDRMKDVLDFILETHAAGKG